MELKISWIKLLTNIQGYTMMLDLCGFIVQLQITVLQEMNVL